MKTDTTGKRVLASGNAIAHLFLDCCGIPAIRIPNDHCLIDRTSRHDMFEGIKEGGEFLHELGTAAGFSHFDNLDISADLSDELFIDSSIGLAFDNYAVALH